MQQAGTEGRRLKGVLELGQPDALAFVEFPSAAIYHHLSPRGAL
jgi:hypothetical protein